MKKYEVRDISLAPLFREAEDRVGGSPHASAERVAGGV